MENETKTVAEPVKLRANRKAVEALCGICGRGFELAEEVYACPFCSGFHHAACWETRRACPGLNGGGADPREAAVEGEEEPPQTARVPELAPDERHCPDCSHAIKREALKCRFCGAVFDPELVAQVAPLRIPPELAKEVESNANKALWMSIVSIFFCAPIMGPAAISHGRDAHKLLAQYPSYAADSWAGGKARAGIIIGWCAIVLFVLGLIGRFG